MLLPVIRLQVWYEGGNCNVTGGLICLHLKDHRMMMDVIYTVVIIFSRYVSRVVRLCLRGLLLGNPASNHPKTYIWGCIDWLL